MDEARPPWMKWRRWLIRLAGIGIAGLGLACLIPVVATRTLARPSIGDERAQGVGYPVGDLIAEGASASVDLGTVVAGGRAAARLRFTNGCDSWIEISRVPTSCPCLTVELANVRIAPHGTMHATARIDLSDDPEFVGGLCPEFQCFDAFGKERFVGSVAVQVVAEPGHSRNVDRISRSQEVVR